MDELSQASVDLRPLGLGELLDRTFTLYRNNFFLFCGIMALPETLIVLASLTFTLATRGTFTPLMTAPQNPPPDPRQVFAVLGSMFGGFIVFYVIYALIYVAAVSATTFAVAAVYLGKNCSIRDAYRKIRGRFGTLIGFCMLMFVILLAIWIGVSIVTVITAVVAGSVLSTVSPILGGIMAVLVLFSAVGVVIWLMMRFSLSVPVLLLENRGAVDSMVRSSSLTQGHRGRVFLGILVIFAIAFGINTAITVPTTIPLMIVTFKHSFMPAWLVVLQSLSAGIAGTLTGPLLSIALALIYYDVRIRKEAFDLEFLSARAAPVINAAPPSGSAPVPL